MMRFYRFATWGTLSALLLLSLPAFGALAPAPAAVALPLPQIKPAPEPPPRAELSLNPALSYADRLLSEDTVWRGEVLVEGAVTVAPQATLSIEPGTVVRFRRKGNQAPLLVVQGRLVAVGTREAPILFSSSFVEPMAADWQGVMLLGSEKKNTLENCRIEGAQTGFEALFSSVTLKSVRVERSGVGMRFQDTLVAMESGGASGCDIGLSFSESEADLRSLSLVSNRLGLSARKSSVYLLEANLSGNQTGFSCDGCRVKIQGGAFLGNGEGVTLLGCEGSVTGARIAKNREYGMSLTASRVRVSANQITGNGENGLIVFDASSVAWDNAIYENAGYDLFNAGTEEFRAPGNWWGASAPKIFDNAGRGKVLYAPLRSAIPPAQAR
jgi:hypothetical protein